MNLKLILKLAAAVVLLYGLYLGYSMFQDNSIKYKQFEHTIDSLSTQCHALDSVHVKQDSVIVVYQDSIVYLDNVIEKEKTKYVEIKQKYTEIHNIMKSYNSNQVDSFFKNRYNY